MAPLGMATLCRSYMILCSKAWALQRLHPASRAQPDHCLHLWNTLRSTKAQKAFSLIGPCSIHHLPLHALCAV